MTFLACAEPFDGTIALADANNYAYTSGIDVGETIVTAGQDFTIDWSDLTTDLLGHPLDPAAEIDRLMLVALTGLTATEIEEAIVEESLVQADVRLAALYYPEGGATSAAVSAFEIPVDNPFDPAEYFHYDPEVTWLLVASTGEEARMTHFVVPGEGGGDTVTLGPSSAALTFDADLASLAPVEVPVVEDATVDWSALTAHAGGRDIDLDDLDRLLLARYDDLTVEELEADFVDVELLASHTWTADVYGVRSLALSAAADDDGAAFPGFTAGPVWLLALQCDEACTSPAPPFLTVIEVTE